MTDKRGPFSDYQLEDTIAWVDESGSNSTKDPGTYILSAAVCFAEDIEETRQATRLLLKKGQRKLHWIDESAERRLTIIETISGFPLENIVVVRSYPDVCDKPERRRRKCLERLIMELESLEVTAMVLESRGNHQDKLDMEMLSHLCTQQIVSTIRMHHKTGPSDPMLWVPDACCGAVVEKRCGTPVFYSYIEEKTTVYLI